MPAASEDFLCADIGARLVPVDFMVGAVVAISFSLSGSVGFGVCGGSARVDGGLVGVDLGDRDQR
jgi:hypothetical protein